MCRTNGNRFSVYTSEEKTVLGLLDELGSQVNHNTDNLEIVFESDSKTRCFQQAVAWIEGNECENLF